MTKPTFTPGPWVAAQMEDGRFVVIADHGIQPHICYTTTGVSADKEEANAHLLAASRDLYAALKAYEQWEADLISSDEAWQGGMAAMPTLTQELYDRMMELQAMRNAALSRANGGAE